MAYDVVQPVLWTIKYVDDFGEAPSDFVVNYSIQQWTEEALPGDESNLNKGITFLGWYTKDGIKANVGDYILDTFGITDYTDNTYYLYARWSFTYFILDNTLERMANAIRKLAGETGTMLPEEMPSNIEIPYLRKGYYLGKYIHNYLIQMGYNEEIFNDGDEAGNVAPRPL